MDHWALFNRMLEEISRGGRMSRRMKLFVWRDVLCDFGCGIAVAMAETVEEARKLLIEDNKSLFGEVMNTEPEIYEEPKGISVWGGG